MWQHASRKHGKGSIILRGESDRQGRRPPIGTNHQSQDHPACLLVMHCQGHLQLDCASVYKDRTFTEWPSVPSSAKSVTVCVGGREYGCDGLQAAAAACADGARCCIRCHVCVSCSIIVPRTRALRQAVRRERVVVHSPIAFLDWHDGQRSALNTAVYERSLVPQKIFTRLWAKGRARGAGEGEKSEVRGFLFLRGCAALQRLAHCMMCLLTWHRLSSKM